MKAKAKTFVLKVADSKSGQLDSEAVLFTNADEPNETLSIGTDVSILGKGESLFEGSAILASIFGEDQINAEGFLELFVFGMNEKGDEAKASFYDFATQNVKGIKSIWAGMAVKGGNHVDIMVWDSQEHADAGHEILMASDAYTAFKESVTSLSLYKRFDSMCLGIDVSVAPDLVDVESGKFLSLAGKGSPKGDEFQKAIMTAMDLAVGVSHSLGNGAQFNPMTQIPGSVWTVEGDGFEQVPMDEWNWEVRVPVPSIAVSSDLTKASQNLDGSNQEIKNRAKLKDVKRGSYVQALHVGSYDSVPDTIGNLVSYSQEKGIKLRMEHHEIYISDPSVTPEAELKTILRYPVDC